MKILITAPSLNPDDNVSGISTIVSALISRSSNEFLHFTAGRRDRDSLDVKWLARQALLPVKFKAALHRFSPGIVHINTSFEMRSLIRDLALLKACGDVPRLLHIHGGRYLTDEPATGRTAQLIEMMLRSAQHILVLSDEERRRVSAIVPERQVTILPNAVDVDSFAGTPSPNDKRTILYLGRLDPNKGLTEIVEACRLLKNQGFDFRFQCFGRGPEEERFGSAMKEILAGDFVYGGVVAGAEKTKALQNSDVFLMPSRFEGLPLSLLEAMAAGCVPVVSDRGSMATVVEDGRNGFLVEPGNVTQIVGRLKFLLGEGDSDWAAYREAARETIASRFDIGAYVDKLDAIYHETAANYGSPRNLAPTHTDPQPPR